MSEFKQQQISTQYTIGEQLHAARVGQEMTIEEIAESLKIASHYIAALERGRYTDLPSPVYVKNYLRLYVKELRLNWDEIEQQYEKEIAVFHDPKISSAKQRSRLLPKASINKLRKKNESQTTQSHYKKPLLIPRLIKLGLVGIAILLLLVYFGWGIAQFISPPELRIDSPLEDMITSDRTVTIQGQTEPEAIVTINEQSVSIAEDGSFTEEIFLHEGVNTIQVSTRTKRSREHTQVRHILYEEINE